MIKFEKTPQLNDHTYESGNIPPGKTFMCRYKNDENDCDDCPNAIYMMVNPRMDGEGVCDILVNLKTGLGTPCIQDGKYLMLTDFRFVDIMAKCKNA